MKAFSLKWALILLIVLLITPLQAKTSLQIQYKYEYLKSFALKLKGLQQTTHYIDIKDANGQTLIHEAVSQQAQFGRMYNLENLPEGTYTVLIENDRKVIMQPIEIQRRFLSIYDSEQKEILKPAILIANDFITINMLHFEKEAIIFNLKDHQEQVLYTDNFKSYGSLNKQLNISNLPQGTYELIIQTNTYSVIKKFTRKTRQALLASEFQVSI